MLKSMQKPSPKKNQNTSKYSKSGGGKNSNFKKTNQSFRGRKQFAGTKDNSHDKEQHSNAPLNPRRASFLLLEAVLIDKRALDMVEHNILKQVDDRNRSLVKMIVYTALRRNNELDALIDHLLTSEIGTEQVRVFLKVGLCQILFMDIEDHAAVFETLNAVFGKALPSKGMMNAILRRATTEGSQFLNSHTDIINVPKYLWRTWVSSYGEKVSRHILDAHKTIAPLDLSVKSDPEKWADILGGIVLPTGGVRILNKTKLPSSLTNWQGFKQGEWWVQDMAAQIPAILFGEDLHGKTIVDMCAAPGGKTAQLLVKGARVIAIDHNKIRAERLRENMKRLGLEQNLKIVVADAVKYKCDELVDGVLLDAPCSSTGTIRKNPDIPFLKDKELITSVARLQRHMIAVAGEMLKENGILIYSTCSIQQVEGEEHIRYVGDELKLIPVRRKELKGLEQVITTKGTIRTLPCQYKKIGAMDGFFVARFKKV